MTPIRIFRAPARSPLPARALRSAGRAVALVLLSLGMSGAAEAQAPAKNPQIVFRDVTEELGIHWQHVNGATPEKYLIETMGGGGAFLDYNRDGRLDIFLVNSGCHKFSGSTCTPGSRSEERRVGKECRL